MRREGGKRTGQRRGERKEKREKRSEKLRGRGREERKGYREGYRTTLGNIDCILHYFCHFYFIFCTYTLPLPSPSILQINRGCYITYLNSKYVQVYKKAHTFLIINRPYLLGVKRSCLDCFCCKIISFAVESLTTASFCCTIISFSVRSLLLLWQHCFCCRIIYFAVESFILQ